jgi:hypothetical protein
MIIMMELAKTYEPKEVEDKLYKRWMENGYFHAKIDPNKTPYTIVIPPPNITGQLHMGHALDNTLQDILIRMKRMQGYSALWLPGTDHASIATEARIVEKLKEEGVTKEDLGREKFLERAWEWKKQYGGRIVSQLKKLGSSCDWEEVQWMKDQYDAKLIPAPFNDMNKTSSWAVGSVLLAQQKGIFRGDQNGNLRPRDYVTRGEAAAVLRRTMALQGLLFTPKTIKGILQISTVEGEHLELKTTDESGETFVIIPSDDILKNKLLQYLNKEVILTGFEEDRPSIYIKKMFQALAIGDKIELYCWRCEQKKKEEQQ